MDEGIGDVDHVNDEVGVDGFVEGGTEGLDQLRWEVLDEADGVGVAGAGRTCV